MAQKRMFSLSVVDTDQFLEMPLSSRLLYYELGMRADDDGFVANWKKILAFTGLKEDDMKVLIAKQYVIPFESGVIVIRHWRMNNYLQNDRTKPTIYQNELSKLSTDDNNVYNMYTECIHSIDKNSIDKNRLDNKETKNYFEDEKLNDIFNEFLQLRKKLKAVNSDRAINSLLKKLENYDDDTKFKMIDNSIRNSWKDVYEPKQTKETKYEETQRKIEEWLKDE